MTKPELLQRCKEAAMKLDSLQKQFNDNPIKDYSYDEFNKRRFAIEQAEFDLRLIQMQLDTAMKMDMLERSIASDQAAAQGEVAV